MKYETFVDKVREAVQNCMGEEMVIEKKEVIKNNSVSVAGLMIADRKDNYSSFLDLQFQYLLYLQDEDMDSCVQQIIAEYEKKKEERGKMQEVMARVREWDNVREQVYPILISYEDNKEWLAEAVHQRFLDLAICFAVRVPEVHGNIKVKRNLFNLWGITETVLETQAMENLMQDGYTISSVLDILEEMGDASCKERVEEDLGNEIPLRILSNANCCLGAAGILHRELLAEYAAKIDKNLFLLPSSLHEIMILPADKGTVGNELKAMVQEINQDCVNPEEKLSDHVYYFDREDNSIRIAA